MNYLVCYVMTVICASIISTGYCLPNIEKIAGDFQLGEASFWDASCQCLYFVDVYGGSIHKYIPKSKFYSKAYIGKSQVSIIIPVKGQANKFLISMNKTLAVLVWDGQSDNITHIAKIVKVENEPEENVFNDGKCDPSGRLWIGTVGPNPSNSSGALYSLEPNGKLKTQLARVGFSNGLTWSLDHKYFYFVDSQNRTVTQFDFDIKDGRIDNPKIIFTLNTTNLDEVPDGLTIDTNGNLWIALFGGNGFIKIDPRNPQTLLERIQMPSYEVTSLTIGGRMLDSLYVTTGSLPLNGVEYPRPINGGTYVVTGLGITGRPGVKANLNFIS